MEENEKTNTNKSLRSLENLNFDNSALRELPIDKEERNFVRRSVAGACYSKVTPTPVDNPKLVKASDEALLLLDLDPKEIDRPDFAEYLAGNKLLPGSQPLAHNYCGHQFGHFSGQLGDGRAMYLGEIVNSKGERYEIQFKGAGRTPYSRDGDGRAVLRSSIREFLCSEAMYHLGIPTTRAGSVVTSDSYVVRDIKYDGNPKRERCTIVLRIAPTFVRFGSFQIVLGTDPITGRKGPSTGRYDITKKLLEWVIEKHYNNIWTQNIDLEEKYGLFFGELVERTAKMVADWQCVGFGHGVLNTDNLSIVGVTIDYGPFGFCDQYDPDFICNGSDNEGRYSLKNQPSICKWDLERLADSLNQLIPQEKLDRHLLNYWVHYNNHYISKMRKKLGLKKMIEEDKDLVEELLTIMNNTAADFTNTFRLLNKIPINSEEPTTTTALKYIMGQLAPHTRLLQKWEPRVPPQQLQMMLMVAKQRPEMLEMMGVSPQFLREELDRIEKSEKIQKITETEKHKMDSELWSNWIQKYQKRLAIEVEGLSGVELENAKKERIEIMNQNNPKYILRNYLAQRAIEQAEKGDYTEVDRLLTILRNPYKEEPIFTDFNYDDLPPDWSSDLCVT